MSGRECFNSLFVGMCFAIIRNICVNGDLELLVSIPFSSGCALQFEEMYHHMLDVINSFNSLFVGMCFAILFYINIVIGTH